MTEWTEKLGMDAVEIREFMSRQLTLRGEKLSARITLAIEDAGMLRDRLATSPDDADLKQRLAAAAMRKGQADAHLDLTVEMMSRLDMDPSRYQALLLETTGQLSPAVLSVDAVQSLARTWYKRLRTWVVDRGPGLFSSVIILIAVLLLFRLVARLLRKLIERSLDTSKVEISKLAREMLLKVVYNGVMAIGLLVGLSQMGISLGPLLAGLGVAGFIVGFALQDTLGNFASGMMILIYRPFDVGDLVEAAGIMGKVKGMSLVSTTILTLDHQTIIVPNNRIWGDVIKNVTAQEIRRVDMLFGISYTDDIPLAEKVLTEILSGHELVLDDPESQVKLHELGDSSVNFVVRPWTKTDDYWDVYWDVTREVKLRFDREGISIPFPQRDVHLYRADAESAG
ncbi:MAG: mechanosensitive ion channel family protein [bacterium]|nr:mechanosensitive ion channel family protein [bacterium]